MPRFAANISLLYNEHAFLDRFAAAASDGFQAVEFLFPYAFSTQDIAQRLRDNGLQQVLFNAPPGNWEAGERGIACLPGRETPTWRQPGSNHPGVGLDAVRRPLAIYRLDVNHPK
jgi:hydroxypyruvate isomerase